MKNKADLAAAADDDNDDDHSTLQIYTWYDGLH
jgi:hypothetical protein